MARTWLSFWNQETRAGRRTPGAASGDSDIYVPYGKDKLARGDKVYCVAIDGGELLLYGRVVVGRIDDDPSHAESLNVWAESGTETDFWEDLVVDDALVDQLVYLNADGSEHHLRRNGAGDLVGTPFQGRASIRELARGAQLLDKLVES